MDEKKVACWTNGVDTAVASDAESDARIAAVTAERDKALADAARWRREHESLRMDFAALVQKEMALRGQTEAALCGRPVEDPVSKVVTLAARVASERAAAVKDGEAIRAAIGADLDAPTEAVIARLSASRDDLMESGSRVAFLRRSGMEVARRMAATMCYEMQSKEADPVRGQAIRDVLTALASLNLGEVEGLARLPPDDYSIMRDAWANMMRSHHAAALAHKRPLVCWVVSKPARKAYTYEEMAGLIERGDPVGEEYLRDGMQAVMSTRAMCDAHLVDLMGATPQEHPFAAAKRIASERAAAITEVSLLRAQQADVRRQGTQEMRERAANVARWCETGNEARDKILALPDDPSVEENPS